MPHSGGFAKENVIKCSCSVWNSTLFGHLENILLSVNTMFVFSEILYNYLVLEILESLEKIKEGGLITDANIQQLIDSDNERYFQLNVIRDLDECWEGKLLETLASEQCHTFCIQQMTNCSSTPTKNKVATVNIKPLRAAANPKKRVTETDAAYAIRCAAYQQARVASRDLYSAILKYICLRVRVIHHTILTPHFDPEDPDNEDHVLAFSHDAEHGVRVGDRSYIHTLIQRLVDQKIVNSKVSLSSDFMIRVIKIIRKEIEVNDNFNATLNETVLNSRGTVLNATERKAVQYILTRMFVNSIFDYPSLTAQNVQGNANQTAFEFITQLENSEGAGYASLMALEHAIVEDQRRLLPDFTGTDATVLRNSLLFREDDNGNANVVPVLVNQETNVHTTGYGNKKFIEKHHARYWSYARYLNMNEKKLGFKYKGILPNTAIKCRSITLDPKTVCGILQYMYHANPVNFANLFVVEQQQTNLRPNVSGLIQTCLNWRHPMSQSILKSTFLDDPINFTNLLQNILRFPSKLSNFSNVITTNLVSASFHQRFPIPEDEIAAYKAKIKLEKVRQRELFKASWNEGPMDVNVPVVHNISEIPRGINKLGIDLSLDPDSFRDQNIDISCDDPGHSHLHTVVVESMEHRQNPNLPIAQTTISVTNKSYRHDTKMTWAKKKNDGTRKNDKAVRKVWKSISYWSAKTSDPRSYLNHAGIIWRHQDTLFKHHFIKGYRLRDFIVFQEKQRYNKKILIPKLCPNGVENTVLVVGNGVTRPTSRGFDSAPLRLPLRELGRLGVKVVLTDERYTTKRSYCCTINNNVQPELAVEPAAVVAPVPVVAIPLGVVPPVAALGAIPLAVQPDAAEPEHIDFHRGHYDKNAKKRKRGKEIRGLSHCKSCGNTFDRDVAAALNIRKLFWYQNVHRTFDNCLKDSVNFIPWSVH